MRDLLRPKPFRGDQVAAGTVLLTVLVLLLQFRFEGRWSDDAQLIVSGGSALFVLAMALPVPTDGGNPRAYLGTLYICAWALSLIALANLAGVFDVSVFSAGTATWMWTALAGLGLFFSRRRDAATGTLLATISGTVAFAEFINWVFTIDTLTDLRRVLLLVAIVIGLCALWQRVRGPAHGVQLLNAGGLVMLVIAGTFVVPEFLGFLISDFHGPPAHPGTGWAILELGTGFGLVAAGAADGERGNVIVGIAVFALFALMSTSGDLIGWPIVLALAAGTLLIIGLRPSTPLPPEPDHDDDPGPLVTLRAE